MRFSESAGSNEQQRSCGCDEATVEVPQDDRAFEFGPGRKIKLFNGSLVRKSCLFHFAPQHVLLPS
jgi:hypothetical protein